MLVEYDFTRHVASDVGIDQTFLPPASYDTQDNINQIVQWTDSNLMKLNAAKCNYMIFSRSSEQFTTRLSVKGKVIDRIRESKILGLWISDTLSWSRNCIEIC